MRMRQQEESYLHSFGSKPPDFSERISAPGGGPPVKVDVKLDVSYLLSIVIPPHGRGCGRPEIAGGPAKESEEPLRVASWPASKKKPFPPTHAQRKGSLVNVGDPRLVFQVLRR